MACTHARRAHYCWRRCCSRPCWRCRRSWPGQESADEGRCRRRCRRGVGLRSLNPGLQPLRARVLRLCVRALVLAPLARSDTSQVRHAQITVVDASAQQGLTHPCDRTHGALARLSEWRRLAGLGPVPCAVLVCKHLTAPAPTHVACKTHATSRNNLGCHTPSAHRYLGHARWHRHQACLSCSRASALWHTCM